MGNGARVAAFAVGVYDLTLPSGLVFQLKNCYYVPAVSSFSFLFRRGWISLYY